MNSETSLVRTSITYVTCAFMIANRRNSTSSALQQQPLMRCRHEAPNNLLHTPSSTLCQVQTGADDNDNSQIKHLYLNLASDSESGPPESRYDHCRLQLSTESSISTAAKRSYQRARLRLSSSIPGLPPVGVGRRRPPPPPGRSCGRRASPRCILVERVRARHRPQRVAGRAALQAHRAAGLLASAARGHSSLRHRQSRHGSGRGRHAAKPAAREPRRPDTARPARRSYGSEQALAWRGRASHSVDALRLEAGTGAPGSPAPRAAVSFSSRGWRRNGKTM